LTSNFLTFALSSTSETIFPLENFGVLFRGHIRETRSVHSTLFLQRAGSSNGLAEESEDIYFLLIFCHFSMNESVLEVAGRPEPFLCAVS